LEAGTRVRLGSIAEAEIIVLIDVGDELELKTLGFTVDYMINDNASVRFSYHSNFIDDDELDADMMRFQFNYGWNPLVENVKQLEHH